jgi:ubiquinone/menaquinone biosynthesis C-methylase UbiE
MNPDHIQSFNRRSRMYEDSWLQQLYFDHIHEDVLRLAATEPAPRDVLDIGCGTGRLLRKIRERDPNALLMGVDPAEGMIEKARQLMPDATFSVASAESLPLPDASVDLAFSTVSFHHWSDQVQGIREIRRVLRPGGQFLLADAAVPAFLAKMIRHGQIRDPAGIRRMFTEAGLEVWMQKRTFLWHTLVTVGVKHKMVERDTKSRL